MKRVCRWITGVVMVLMLTGSLFLYVYALPAISDVVLASDGTLSWTAFPGADYYYIELDHPDVPNTEMLGNVTSVDLNGVFEQYHSGYPSIITSGIYNYRLIAVDTGGNQIAQWDGSFPYNYTPPAPLKAAVSADNILSWKPYPNAASYAYSVDDKTVYAEPDTYQADLKQFLNTLVVTSGVANTGSHSVTLYAYDTDGHELQRWEGSCNYTVSFDISMAEISNVATEYLYTGMEILPPAAVYFGAEVLIAGKDYTISFSDNVNIGTATITVTGNGLYKGKKQLTFKIIPAPADNADAVAASLGISAAELKEIGHLTLTVPDQTYTGKALKPQPVFSYAAQPLGLREGTDYSISFKNNRKIGTASLTVTGQGAYSGTQTVKFKIVPKGTKLKRLRGKSKSIQVTWKAQKKQVTGYQIQYSRKSSFKKAKTVTVRRAGTTGKVIRKLKKGKRYYVRIRTYKKAGGKKYCSAWSEAKKVIVR